MDAVFIICDSVFGAFNKHLNEEKVKERSTDVVSHNIHPGHFYFPYWLRASPSCATMVSPADVSEGVRSLSCSRSLCS